MVGNTKEYGKEIKCMAGEHFYGQMAENSKGSIKTERNMDSEFFYSKKEELYKFLKTER